MLRSQAPVQAPSEYQTHRDGDWLLWIDATHWNDKLWSAVREVIKRQSHSKHPQTERLLTEGDTSGYFLKTFHGSPGTGFKDRFRQSKARRALLASAALSAAGFHAPFALAAGEERRHGSFVCGFVLTLPVPGVALPDFLGEIYRWKNSANATVKHAAVRQLAGEIRRFHALGFVHGDLVATNLFVARSENGEIIFYFMDNDRTRRYPASLPQSLWKRNLVQLNRIPLPGIFLQDRVRFLYAYLGTAGTRSQSLARWLEHKTRQRRWDCDGIRNPESFRRLMRWDGPTPASKTVEHA